MNGGKVQVKKKRKEKRKKLHRAKRRHMWYGIGINKYRKSRWIIRQQINKSSQGVSAD
jgi:hypothetical protein